MNKEKYLNAIVMIPATAKEKQKFLKYHKINYNKIDRFKKFLNAKFPMWDHVNFYWKESKSFYLQLQKERSL